jgi:hypothetical protein
MTAFGRSGVGFVSPVGQPGQTLGALAMTFTNYETGFEYQDFFRLDPDDAQAEGYQWARTLADIEDELAKPDPLPPIGEVELI